MTETNHNQPRRPRRAGRGELALLLGTGAFAAASGSLSLAKGSAGTSGAPGDSVANAEKAGDTTSLAETRLTMGKWIETQQIISKERNDWNQGKEILAGRIDLVQREIAGLQEKIKSAEDKVAAANAKREELLTQTDQLKATHTQLKIAVTRMEVDARKLYTALPGPLQRTLEPLHKRIPDEADSDRVSIAERFQSVLGILDGANKANNELTVDYEVRNLSNGKPAEVRVLYIGLAQAYYLSANGEAGIGRPGLDGWKWEPSSAAYDGVLEALEIVALKHSPAFVPLPVRIQ